jgi:hypothetical protein
VQDKLVEWLHLQNQALTHSRQDSTQELAEAQQRQGELNTNLLLYQGRQEAIGAVLSQIKELSSESESDKSNGEAEKPETSEDPEPLEPPESP